MAAYQLKKWALNNGQALSLGTVGTERSWRNWQRRSRNRARSVADEQTARMLLVTRWMTEVQRRLAVQQDPKKAATTDRPALQYDLLSSEKLWQSIAMHPSQAPLRETAGPQLPGMDSEYLLQHL